VYVEDMSGHKDVILKLQSVLLTREKQDNLREEIQTYHSATNFVIREIQKRHLTGITRVIEVLQDDFAEKFDPRVVYLRNVIETAGSEIKKHRRLSRTIRTMRDKPPRFKQGI
jgi:hypothetical protein